MVKCITFDDGGKGDFGTNKLKIPGLGNHYSVTLIYFFQNFQFIGRYTVMILVPKSRKYRISEYHYIVKFIFFIQKITNYRSIYYSNFGKKSQKYFILQHYIVNLLCLLRKLQSIARTTCLILLKTMISIILI